MGFTNKTLTAEIATKIGYGIGTYFGTNAVLMTARDYRRDSRALKRALTGGILCSGVEIIDLQAVPSNVLQFIIRRFGADGGVTITRSHNLAGMVHLKIFDSTGIEISEEKLYKIIHSAETGNVNRVLNTEIGWIGVADSFSIYEKAIIGFLSNHREQLKNASLRVVVDCANGPVSSILPDLLSHFGCEIITLNSHRPRAPSLLPNCKSLSRISETVRATKSDIGIAFDVEARHALFIDSQGLIHTPEETSALLLNSLTHKDHNASIVVSETMNPEVYSDLKYNIERVTYKDPGGLGSTVFRKRALCGVNDTGLYINPQFSPGSDAILCTFKIMIQMVTEKIPLHTLFQRNSYKKQRIESVSFPQKKVQNFFRELVNNPPDDFFPLDTYLGVKLLHGDNSWINYSFTRDAPFLDIEVYNAEDDNNITSNLLTRAKEFMNEYK